jgi:hypothetical protein
MNYAFRLASIRILPNLKGPLRGAAMPLQRSWHCRMPLDPRLAAIVAALSQAWRHRRRGRRGAGGSRTLGQPVLRVLNKKGETGSEKGDLSSEKTF